MKKFLALLMIFCLLALNSPVFAAKCACPEQILRQEHLDVNQKAPANTVTITNYRKILCANNVLGVSFECKFCSNAARAGDVVNFIIPESIYTTEGTLVIPACTKVVAEITKVQHQKWFNKNARVSLIFRCLVLPDGRVMQMCAKPFTKDCTLKEGPWMTTGKIVLSTLTFGILGAGTGVGFSFISHPARIGTGLAIGIPVGCGVGLATALISKGLQYKAKAGEQIFIILLNDTSVCN